MYMLVLCLVFAEEAFGALAEAATIMSSRHSQQSEVLGSALVPVLDVSSSTTTLCGLGCLINFKYTYQTRTSAPSAMTSEPNAHTIANGGNYLSSYLQFSAYSITSALGVFAPNSSGECVTTTAAPVTKFPALTVALNTTIGGSDLDLFAASSAKNILGLTDCFANAVQVTPFQSTTGFKIPISTSATSTSQSTTLISLPLPTQQGAVEHRITPQGKTVLAVVLPVVALTLTALLLWWVWHKRHTSGDKVQTETREAEEYTKPELNAQPSRHEMEGASDRQELAGNQLKYELDTKAERYDQQDLRSQHHTIELRGSEPSFEMDV